MYYYVVYVPRQFQCVSQMHVYFKQTYTPAVLSFKPSWNFNLDAETSSPCNIILDKPWFIDDAAISNLRICRIWMFYPLPVNVTCSSDSASDGYLCPENEV